MARTMSLHREVEMQMSSFMVFAAYTIRAHGMGGRRKLFDTIETITGLRDDLLQIGHQVNYGNAITTIGMLVLMLIIALCKSVGVKTCADYFSIR